MSYNQKTGEYVRNCKQCGEIMAKPLEVGDKLFMFCSTKCHDIWDRERAYRADFGKEGALDGY